MRKFIFLIALGLLWSVHAWGQEEQAPAPETSTVTSSRTMPTLERPDPISWNARLGAGTAIDPSVFWLTFEGEVQLDKFLAIGPRAQVGFGDVTTYTLVSMGPRITLPLGFFEWYFGGSAGLAYRDQTNVQFSNFMFELSTGLEIYLLKNLSLGGALRMNWISSNAVDNIPVVTGFVSGHF
ncbi:MAG: hypothetical protein KDD46_00545 [Bdellovibrionales bacterium]|nr:hypothetical protein [Bdellovibrionales bacterium]